MDLHTLLLLEFDKVRVLLASHAACALGKERALRVEPTSDAAWIHEQQAMTTEIAEALSVGKSPPLGGVSDIRAAVARSRTGATLEPEELAEIASVLRAVGDTRIWLERAGDQFPRLGGLGRGIGEFQEVRHAIESCLDNRARVLETASRRLSTIRREIDQVEQRIQETLRQMLRSPELKRIVRFHGFTMVGHHYVLPIAREHRGEIQGSVHRTSASNETVYVEPQAIADQSAHLSLLRAREHKEVRRILRWLSAQVGQRADDLLETLETLAQLDLVAARGRLSRDFQMNAPSLAACGNLVLRAARHPVLEHLFRGEPGLPILKERGNVPLNSVESNEPSSAEPARPEPRRAVVPIDVMLGSDAPILVITGPNTGGKTVALKTVGLLAVMAQSGLHVPAAPGSCLPIFDNVFADIGDEQSLEQSLSTFSAHVRRISTILERATARSLVLIDEVGAGTDPVEGAALGRSVLDELDAVGCVTLVTTHIGELKTFALHNARARNAAVEFDIETLRPSYRLLIGEIGQSNALQIARRLNMPAHVVERAWGYLRRGESDPSAEWELVRKLKQDAESARSAALNAEVEATRLQRALTERLDELRIQAESQTRLEQSRQRLQPGDRVFVSRFGADRPGRIVKLDPRKSTALVAIGAMQWDVPLAEIVPDQPRSLDADATKRSTTSLDDFDNQ